MINISPIWLPALMQQNYRAILEAMARPGCPQPIHFHADSSEDQADDSTLCEDSTLPVLASLLDNSVSLADPHGLTGKEHAALLQAQQEVAEQADFIVCRGEQVPAFKPRLGTLSSPELSATIIIRVKHIEDAKPGELNLKLSGPGVKEEKYCSISGLHPAWLGLRNEWVSSFPLGVDLLLVDDARVMALPRTTKVEQKKWDM